MSGFGIQIRRINDEWDAAYRDLEAELTATKSQLELAKGYIEELEAKTESPSHVPSTTDVVDRLIEGMLKTIEKAAKDYVRDWPNETYVRNDLPAFFEQGAMWAIRSMAPRLTLTTESESTKS
jgi:uncharacterized membrane protein